MLITAGAVTSVGAIAIWQTRQALMAERYERAAALTLTARNLVGVILTDSAAGTADPIRVLERLAPDIAHAIGADEVVFMTTDGKILAPRQAQALANDVRGVAAAVTGAPPHAEERARGGHDAGGLRLVSYASIPHGVLRATFPVEAEIDARLARTRLSLIALGAIDGLVLLFAAILIVRSAVIRPVQELEIAARKVAEGDLETRVESRGPGELGSLADAFDRMTGSLREGRDSLIRSEKLASVGRLAAGLAHEVGNPLAAILGYVETLLTDAPDRPIDPRLRQEILRRIGSETERIHRIVTELLDYSRPHHDVIEPVDVREAVEAAMSLVRAQARAKAFDMELRLPDTLPKAHAAGDRLVQVFLNLLLNAVDATEGKGKVTIDGQTRNGRVVITVSDNGPGIPREARDKVFDPFYTTKDPGKGTGLGLAVSLGILEGFGGTIRLAPSEHGACFEVELPGAPV